MFGIEELKEEVKKIRKYLISGYRDYDVLGYVPVCDKLRHIESKQRNEIKDLRDRVQILELLLDKKSETTGKIYEAGTPEYPALGHKTNESIDIGGPKRVVITFPGTDEIDYKRRYEEDPTD